VKILAGVVGGALVVSIVALLIGVGSQSQTCEATGGDDFAFVAGLVCVCVGALGGVVAIVQAIRRRRARPDFWWYLGSATAGAAAVVVGTAAAASGFTFCLV
jgi:hypothetical protein